MNNRKLYEIGEKLEITEDEINEIKKERLKSKLIYPFTIANGVIITIISYVLGYNKGKNKPTQLVSADTGKTYPFCEYGFSYFPNLYYVIGGATGLGALIAVSKSKHKKFLIGSIIVTVIGSILAFKYGYYLEQPNVRYYHGAIDYGVYYKNKVNINEL